MHWFNWLESLAHSSLLLTIAIGVIATIESVAVLGLILPGAFMMTAAASVAGNAGLSIPVMLLSGTIGAVIGDSISYWIGKTQRERIPRLWPFSRHPSWLERGEHFFARYGALSILIGRFVGPVRPLIPMVAGMMSMPQLRFLIVNVLSAIGWAPLYLLPGYYLGLNVHVSPIITWWLIGLCAIAGIAMVFFSWGRRLVERPHSPYRPALWMTGLGLLLFVMWTVIIWRTGDAPLTMDRMTYDLFLTLHHSPLWLTLATWLADIGDKPGILALATPWVLWWLLRRHYAVGLHWCAALGGVALLNTVIKHAIERPRPSLLLHSYSYPSAHTSCATVIFGLTAAFVARSLSPRLRNCCYWSAIAAVLIMALSRLVCAVHWASDLIGGMLLGVVVCGLTRLSYHRFAQQPIAWQGWWLPALMSVILLLVRINLGFIAGG